jgi:hypothetical protein
MSNAPAAKLAWMLTTVLTAPAGRPARVSPARSCSSVMTRKASGQPVQHALAERRLRQLHECFGIEVHTQDGPGRRRGDQMLLAPPVGGAARRLILLPGGYGRHEDDMLDARLYGRVDGSDVLRTALSGFRIDGSAQMAAGATHTDFHATSNTSLR